MKHKVFVMRPQYACRKIREIEAEIVVCGKTTWAEQRNQAGARLKRYLLGTSAFYTRPAAERAKLGALRKLMLLRSFPEWTPQWRVGNEATRQVQLYELSGAIH